MRRVFPFFALIVATSLSTVGQDQPKPADKPAIEKPAAGSNTRVPNQQDLDDEVEPLVPLKPKSLVDDNRVKASAWFAVGRLLEEKRDLQGALEAYKKAVALDPQAAPVCKALSILCEALNLKEEALKWAERAAEADPSDYALLFMLGARRLEKRDVPGAVGYWEQALKAPRFKEEKPGLYVTLHKEMAAMYLVQGLNEEAAKSLEIVFDSLEDGLVKIDFQTKAKLLGEDASATYEQLGQVFLETTRYPLAIKAFRKASDLKKGGSANLSFNLARVYLKTNEPDKALQELQPYFDAQKISKGRSAYELLAEILQAQGKSQDLIARLEELAEKDPRNSALQYFLADQYRDAKRFEDAERVYRKTLLFAAEPQGYQGLALILQQQNKPAELLEVLGKAFAKADDMDVIETQIKALAADAKLVDALLATGQKAKDGASLDFSDAVVLASILAEAKRREPAVEFYRYALALRKHKDIYFGLVEVLFDGRKYAEAAKVLEEGMREDDGENELNYQFTLVRARELAGDTPGALDSLSDIRRKMRRRGQDDVPQLDFEEGWIYYHAHKFDEAIPRFEKLIAKLQAQPQSKKLLRQAQFSLSNVYVLKGELRKGEEILEQVFKDEPDDPSVNNDLGYLYADQGKNLEQAEKMVQKALASEPENGAYLDSYGWVLFKLGKVQEALPYIEKACQKQAGGSDETLLDHLGDVYDKLQQPAKSLEAWKKALESAKQSPRPDQKLIDKLTEKIKTRETDPGKLKPGTKGSP